MKRQRPPALSRSRRLRGTEQTKEQVKPAAWLSNEEFADWIEEVNEALDATYCSNYQPISKAIASGKKLADKIRKEKTSKKTAAVQLSEALRPGLPTNYECSECLMVNMANPHGYAPELTIIYPSREHYRSHRLSKTLPALRTEVRVLHDAMKAKGGPWHTITLDGCTIYLRPKE